MIASDLNPVRKFKTLFGEQLLHVKRTNQFLSLVNCRSDNSNATIAKVETGAGSTKLSSRFPEVRRTSNDKQTMMFKSKRANLMFKSNLLHKYLIL